MSKTFFGDISEDQIDDIFMNNLMGGTKETPQEDKNETVIKEVEDVDPYIKTQIELEEKFRKQQNKDTEEEVAEEETPVEDNTDTSTKDFTLSPYAAFLKSAGILPEISLEEFDKLNKEEQNSYLLEKQQEVYQSKAEELLVGWVDTLPPKLKQMIQDHESGLDFDFSINTQSKLEYYKSIDDAKLKNDEDLARKILKEDYMANGVDENEANELADEPTDPYKYAKRALDRRIKSEESKISKEKEAVKERERLVQENQKKYLGELKDFVDKSPEYIPGLPLDKKLKDKIWSNMTTVIEEKNGQRLDKLGKYIADNPIKSKTVLNYLYELTDGFTKVDKIIKTTKNLAIKDLEDRLKNEDVSKGGTPMNFDKEKKMDTKTLVKNIAKSLNIE